MPDLHLANITIVDIAEEGMIPAVSSLHLEAFNGYLNGRLGPEYASALIDWFAREKQAIAIAAIDKDQRVIGYALGAPSSLAHRLRQDMFWLTARSIVLRPWLLCDLRLWRVGTMRLKNAITLRDVAPSSGLPEPTMSLFGIGVVSSHRKMGVGLRLMQAFEAKAKTLKTRSLLLCVQEDKISTRRLYEKCGWNYCPDVLGETGVSKYVRLLDQ